MKTILSWLKIANLSKKTYLQLLTFLLLEAICYIILPLSYAKITTSATLQNYSLTSLWAGINLMLQILSIIINSFSSSKISALTKHLTNKFSLEFEECFVGELSMFLTHIYSGAGFLFRALAIILSATIYSPYLAIYLLIAIVVCLLISAFGNNLAKKKKTSFESLSFLPDIIWSGFTYAIILYIIHLLRIQEISLSAFLLLSTFISTHLLKPNFKIALIQKIKNINNILSAKK